MSLFRLKAKLMLLLVGIFPVLLMAGIEILTGLGFFLGIPVSSGHVLLSLAFSLALIGAVGWKSARLRGILGAFLGIALMVCIAYGLSVHFLDLSWDGQGYHQSAILKLAGGWDPVSTYAKTGSDRLLKYANFYSKGPWVCAASMFRLTGNIETGKLFNLLLMMSSFLLSLLVLLEFNWIRRFSVPLALLAALNPVSVCQMFSFLVDGQLASLIVIGISLGLLFLLEESVLIDIGFFSVVVLCFNVKFNGTAYMGIVVGLLFLGAGLFHRQYLTRRRFRVAVYAGIVAVFIVGFNPYVTNLAGFGNPFHPILGPHKVDVLRLQRPTDFVGANRFTKLYFSLFSRSDNPMFRYLQSSKAKNPFTCSKAEFRWFVQSSLRVGGFGPLFGGALIISILALLGMILLYRKERPEMMLFVAGLILSVIINPDSWWARLAPQLWLLPLIICVYLFSLEKTIASGFGVIILSILLINIAGISWSYTTQYSEGNRQLKKQLLSLEQVPIIVYPGLFKSVRNRLKQFHIPFTEVDNLRKLPCKNPERLTWSTARFCVERDGHKAGKNPAEK